MKNLFIIAAILLLSSAANAQQFASARKAPEIVLQDMNGNTVSLSSLKGKVVLIDFWASWCGPCRRANKHLREIYAKYKDSGLEILSISTDNNRKSWLRAVKDDKMTWLQVIDDRNVAYSWNIRSIPTTFLLDRKGNFAAYDPPLKELDALIHSLTK